MFGIMLQGAGLGFQNLLSQLEDLGFFQYVLPFLLIFAVVYAILTRLKIFEENKGAALIVALAVGLLSLQLNFVPAFFQNIFPKFGIGLSILLVALILVGAFITDEEKTYKRIFFGLGALIFLVVVVTSLSDWQFVGSWWWNQYGGLIITVVVIVGAVVGIVIASKKS